MELLSVGVPQLLLRYVVLGATAVTVLVNVPSTRSGALVVASTKLTVNVITVADPAAALALILTLT